MKPFAATSISIVLAALVANCGGADDHGTGAAGLGRDLDPEATDTRENVSDHEGNGDDEVGVGKEVAGTGGAGRGETESGGTAAGGAAAPSGGASSSGGASPSGGAGPSGGAASSTSGTDASGDCAGATTGGGGGDATPAINATAWLQPDSCERTAAYEVRDVRDQNGLAVSDYTCQWTFSDGGVENTCAGNKAFGDLPGTFYGTVVVRDSATGATTTATSETVRVIEPQALEIWVSSDTCMHFSYDIDRQYGCGGTHVFDIQPAENILTPVPWSTSSQTLQVTAPGVYTLEYTVEGCAASYARTCITSQTATVTVEACP